MSKSGFKNWNGGGGLTLQSLLAVACSAHPAVHETLGKDQTIPTGLYQHTGIRSFFVFVHEISLVRNESVSDHELGVDKNHFCLEPTFDSYRGLVRQKRAVQEGPFLSLSTVFVY